MASFCRSFCFCAAVSTAVAHSPRSCIRSSRSSIFSAKSSASSSVKGRFLERRRFEERRRRDDFFFFFTAASCRASRCSALASLRSSTSTSSCRAPYPLPPLPRWAESMSYSRSKISSSTFSSCFFVKGRASGLTILGATQIFTKRGPMSHDTTYPTPLRPFE